MLRAAVAVLTPISDAEAGAFLRAYDVGELARVSGIAAGSVNSNFAIDTARGRFFLRVYEEQDRAGACAEAVLLDHLARAGVPTPAPLARRDGQRIAELAGKSAALFPWRDGSVRCQASVTSADCRRVGAALAAVHRAGEEHPAGQDAWGASRFQDAQLVERLERIASRAAPELAREAAPLRTKLATWGARRDPSLPRGLIHGDLFRDNVLWTGAGSAGDASAREGSEISALLDFESASDGVLAYDLMVTALAWCVGDALDVALFRAMVAGYESVRPLTSAERAGLVAEGCTAALRFTITRITDYAMRVTEGPRVIKDWRRFAMRLATLESLGAAALLGEGEG